jgi:hypothetical protein
MGAPRKPKYLRHAGCGGGITRGEVPGYRPGWYKGLPFFSCSKCGAGFQKIGGELVAAWNGR